MYCKHCGNLNKKEARFCKKCGKHIVKARFQWIQNNRFKLFLLSPVVVILFIYFINAGLLSSYIDIFPFWPTNPKTTTLTCLYAGKNHKADATLYGNINTYYQGHDYSNKESYIKNGQFNKFVYSNPKDPSIKDLIKNIRDVALANHLNDDQTLELAACFIQNIPYDEGKASYVLKQVGNTANTEQYPYQTLYSNKGICTDKTYLGSAMLKELGYGTGIMAFDEQQHMALGISAPAGYTSYNSKYVYMELTNQGFPPGLIPSEVDPTNGYPISTLKAFKQLGPNDDPTSINLDTAKTIKPPALVLDINTGKTYSRIVTTRNLENDIVKLVNSLDSKKTNLQKAYSNIGYWNNIQSQRYAEYLATPATTQTCYPVYSYYPNFSSRQNCYTSTNISRTLKYSSYSSAINSYNSAVSNYNNILKDYNSTLDTINKDITTYQTYQYN